MNAIRPALLFIVLFTAGTLRAQEKPNNSRDYLNAVLWQQRSAEYRALCFQAYTLARVRIDQLKRVPGERRAIVVDVDETVLDNSAFQGHELRKGIAYDADDWTAWTGRMEADTVPGALSFLKYAASEGISVFYITNRTREEEPATLRNLQKFGFPDADARHFLGREATSDKESRRQLVSRKYAIVLLCGDNLNDFNGLFYKKDQQGRAEALEQVKAEFGRRFIILPNPMYGDWEAPLYGDKKNPTEEEKAELRFRALKQY